MFKCCFSNKVVNTTGEINKKKSKEFTKSIKKNIKKMRKSNFNEKDYNDIIIGYGASSQTFKININSIDWLFLSSSGHIRAEYLRINKFAGKWIAP